MKTAQFSRRKRAGFTLEEVMVSLSIAGVALGAILSGHKVSAYRAEWSSHSQAAHATAIQKLEQTRAAKWDPLADPPVDQLVSGNFPAEVLALDVPSKSTNAIYATVSTSISSVSTDPPLKLIRVDCVWTLPLTGKTFTNTLMTYRAPDQ